MSSSEWSREDLVFFLVGREFEGLEKWEDDDLEFWRLELIPLEVEVDYFIMKFKSYFKI